MGEAARTLAEAIGGVRLAQKDANDVRWFFTDAQGELQLRAMSLEPSIGRGEFDDARVLAAAARYRRINHVFGGMPATHVRVLQRFYEPARWFGLESFGGFAGIALRSEVAKRAFREELAAAPGKDGKVERATSARLELWLKALSARVRNGGKKVTDGDKKLVAKINAACDDLVTDACRAFVKSSTMFDIRERKSRKAKFRALSAGLPRGDYAGGDE